MLLALQRMLDAKGKLMLSRGTVILWWLADNSNMAKFQSKGSERLVIMLLVLDLLRSAWALSLDLRPVWVARDHAVAALVLT